MTALAKNSPRRRIEAVPRVSPQDHPVKASEVLFEGAIACLDSSGRLVKGTTATGLVAVGVMIEAVTGGTTDGEKYGKAQPGVYGPFANSASADLIAVDDIGADCYIVDDNTVALTSNSSARSKAGKIYDVTSEGVFVSIGLSRLNG